MNQIVSLSGGKDSTAMLHMMLERGEKVAAVVFFDTGWEFPAMYDHINLVEKKTGVKVWRLQSKFPFDYWLISRPVVAREGPYKGQVARIGNGWPSSSRRWCTRQKADAINGFCRPYPYPVHCVGYAADENRVSLDDHRTMRYPLKEYGVTERGALEYCYRQGYRWDGLYEVFRRVSCYCCPLQRLGELRKLRGRFPELWNRMLYLEDCMTPESNRGFRDYTTVHDLERRFTEEDKQGNLFEDQLEREHG